MWVEYGRLWIIINIQNKKKYAYISLAYIGVSPTVCPGDGFPPVQMRTEVLFNDPLSTHLTTHLLVETDTILLNQRQ